MSIDTTDTPDAPPVSPEEADAIRADTLLAAVCRAIDAPLPDKLLCRESLLAAKRQILERIAAMLDELDGAIIPELQAAGGCVIGEQRYFAAKDKTEKDRDMPTTADRLLGIVEGDLAAFIGLLSTNAFKAGAVRKLLVAKGCPETFDALFETRTGDVVKVQSFNPRFVK